MTLALAEWGDAHDPRVHVRFDDVGVGRSDLSAEIEQSLGDHGRGRLPRIAGVGLVGETEEEDP